MKRTTSRPDPIRCLLVTPATKFGSWAWLDKIIRASDDNVEWLVVSYGKPPNAPPNVRFVALPETDYAWLGRALATRRLMALNVLYYLPLTLLAWTAGLRFRPHVAVGNGVLATALLMPFKALGCRVLLAFHGYVGHAGRPWHTVLKAVLARTDRAFVNSEGSAEDLRRILSGERITTVLHWADERFFATPLERPPAARLRVLFVGRLDGEKFSQCLRVCEALVPEGIVELQVVGGGELSSHVTGEAMTAHGYVDDLDRLAEIYAGADVVWAPADTTYLSLPGVEALAAGCPIIVSDVPAVDMRAEMGERVPRDLVPPPMGTVVDGVDDTEAVATIRQLAANGISPETRASCRTYAARVHGPDNLRLVLDELRPRA